MRHVLLILSVNAPAPRSLERALEICRDEQAHLTVAHIHDAHVSQSLENRAMTSGFIGERVGEMIHQALEEDDHLRADHSLHQAAKTAKRAGIECQTTQTEGRFAPTVVRLATEHRADHVVIARERRSLLTRLIFGSPVDELRRVAGLELEIVDEV